MLKCRIMGGELLQLAAENSGRCGESQCCGDSTNRPWCRALEMVVDIEKGLDLPGCQLVEHGFELIDIFIPGRDDGVPGITGLLFNTLPIRPEKPDHGFMVNLFLELVVNSEDRRHVVALKKYRVEMSRREKIEKGSFQIIGISGLDKEVVPLGQLTGKFAKTINEFAQTAHFFLVQILELEYQRPQIISEWF